MFRYCRPLYVHLGGHQSPHINERINALSEMLKDKYTIIQKESGVMYWCYLFEHDGHYKVWDCSDDSNPETCGIRKPLRDNRCKFILKAQMRLNSPEKVRPFFYFARWGRFFDDQLDKLRKLPKRFERLYWRGSLFYRNGTVLRGNRKEILTNIQEIITEDHLRRKCRKVYFEELAQSKIALSLPGIGKACHREFEAFAVGTPVIMPEYKQVYYVDLVPNYHYVSVSPFEGESMGDAIRRRYFEVKEDKDFLWHIAENAREYYDTYCRFDASVEWMIKLLEL